MGDDLYRVPKRKVPVLVRVCGGGQEHVSLFVGESAGNRSGAERPVDVINADGDFLVVETRDGEVAFLHRRGLVFVSLALEDVLSEELAGADLVAADLDIEEGVRVVLEDGEELVGVTRYQLPGPSDRLLDFLNAGEPFLPLYRGDCVFLINKARIARVTPA